MSNSYFSFKKFTINQQACAMKVCTDACLFGAWMADQITNQPVKNILDIGTGTGLLSLMLAQKSNANVDAVEVDEEAFKQAAANVLASPWVDRITVFHNRIQDFKTESKYDLVISNPPFYKNDLKSSSPQRNIALHSNDLNFTDLLIAVKRLLASEGKFALLLPFARTDEFTQRANDNGYFVLERVDVRQTDKHDPFRSMLIFSATDQLTALEEIAIKEGDTYSPELTALLKDYYLHL